MSGKFVLASEAERETLDWGTLGWMSRPATTGARDLVVIDPYRMPSKTERRPAGMLYLRLPRRKSSTPSVSR